MYFIVPFFWGSLAITAINALPQEFPSNPEDKSDDTIDFFDPPDGVTIPDTNPFHTDENSGNIQADEAAISDPNSSYNGFYEFFAV